MSDLEVYVIMQYPDDKDNDPYPVMVFASLSDAEKYVAMYAGFYVNFEIKYVKFIG